MNHNFFYKTSKSMLMVAAALATSVSTGLSYAAENGQVDVQPHSNTMQAALHDTVITGRIKTKLLQSEGLKAADIQVTTTNGVVTLDGSVHDSVMKTLAQTQAASVKGVKSVDNNLTVPAPNEALTTKADQALAGAGQAASDSWITMQVKSAILADDVDNGLNISVKTVDGVVILSAAPTSANRDANQYIAQVDQGAMRRIKQLALNVKGVKGVNLAETINPPASAGY